MVTASDIKFWTGLIVSEADAEIYTQVAEQHLALDGGADLPSQIRTEALCYFIASRISNTKQEGNLLSESIAGYSYSKKSTASTSGYWYDLYRELLTQSGVGLGGSSNYNRGKSCGRVDKNVMHIQRRYMG